MWNNQNHYTPSVDKKFEDKAVKISRDDKKIRKQIKSLLTKYLKSCMTQKDEAEDNLGKKNEELEEKVANLSKSRNEAGTVNVVSTLASSNFSSMH